MRLVLASVGCALAGPLQPGRTPPDLEDAVQRLQVTPGVGGRASCGPWEGAAQRQAARPCRRRSLLLFCCTTQVQTGGVSAPMLCSILCDTTLAAAAAAALPAAPCRRPTCLHTW